MANGARFHVARIAGLLNLCDDCFVNLRTALRKGDIAIQIQGETVKPPPGRDQPKLITRIRYALTARVPISPLSLISILAAVEVLAPVVVSILKFIAVAVVVLWP